MKEKKKRQQIKIDIWQSKRSKQKKSNIKNQKYNVHIFIMITRDSFSFFLFFSWRKMVASLLDRKRPKTNTTLANLSQDNLVKYDSNDKRPLICGMKSNTPLLSKKFKFKSNTLEIEKLRMKFYKFCRRVYFCLWNWSSLLDEITCMPTTKFCPT